MSGPEVNEPNDRKVSIVGLELGHWREKREGPGEEMTQGQTIFFPLRFYLGKSLRRICGHGSQCPGFSKATLTGKGYQLSLE